MLWRFKWTMIGVCLFLMVATVPLIWIAVVPYYTATARIRVSPVVPRVLFKTEDNGMVPLYQSFLNTQKGVILSQQVLDRVLDQLDVQQTRWFREPNASWVSRLRGPTPAIARLKNALSVLAVRNTEWINVSMEADDPREAKLIVDAVVHQFHRLVVEGYDETAKERLETLRRDRIPLRDTIKGLIAKKIDVSIELGTDSPAELRSHLATLLNSMQEELAHLTRTRRVDEWVLEQLEAGRSVQSEVVADDKADEAVFAEEDRVYAEDPEWMRFRATMQSHHKQIAASREWLGDSHPTMQRLEVQLEHAQDLLNEREIELDGLWERRVAKAADPPEAAVDRETILDPNNLTYLIERSKQEEYVLSVAIAEQRERVEEASLIARDLANHDQELGQSRELLAAVQQRISELEMEGKAPGRISISRALMSSEPARDRRMVLTVLAVLGALMGGIGAGFLRWKLDPAVSDAGDMTQAVGLPFLGHIPQSPPNTELSDHEYWQLHERIRMVRTALLDRVGGDATTVLITSPGARTGKTTIALLLAKSLAVAGKKVLMVDADFRSGALSERLGLASNLGLIDLLADRANDATAIIQFDDSGHDVLPAGRQSSIEDPELIANGALTRCLHRWKRAYDVILLDSPPVLPVADARILASQADGTVLVVRARYTRKSEAVDALVELSAIGAKMFGTVLIGTTKDSGDDNSYGYYFQHYSGNSLQRAAAERRRVHRRLPLEGLDTGIVECHDTSADGLSTSVNAVRFSGQIADVSRGGMGLVVEASEVGDVGKGKECYVSFKLPDDSRPLVMRAEVRNMRDFHEAGGSGRKLLGLRFLDAPPMSPTDDRERISRFVSCSTHKVSKS